MYHQVILQDYHPTIRNKIRALRALAKLFRLSLNWQDLVNGRYALIHYKTYLRPGPSIPSPGSRSDSLKTSLTMAPAFQFRRRYFGSSPNFPNHNHHNEKSFYWLFKPFYWEQSGGLTMATTWQNPSNWKKAALATKKPPGNVFWIKTSVCAQQRFALINGNLFFFHETHSLSLEN